jgi:hypothetical protein
MKLNVCKTKCNATVLVLTFVMDISYNILKDFGFFEEDFLKIMFLHGEIFEFP